MLRPDHEAQLLSAHAAGDPAMLTSLVARRLSGVPLPRLVGRVEFDGLDLRVDDGVYIPRWTSESIARAAADLLPDDGVALDLCTGCGAVAAAIAARRPRARVVAADLDPRAVACAVANGVDAHVGDLFEALLPDLAGQVDVIVTVPPFVPTGTVSSLAADVREHEPRVALAGGPDGLDVARRIVAESPHWLRPGGSLVVEVGPDQVDALGSMFGTPTWRRPTIVVDPDGDACGLAASSRTS